MDFFTHTHTHVYNDTAQEFVRRVPHECTEHPARTVQTDQYTPPSFLPLLLYTSFFSSHLLTSTYPPQPRLT